MALVFFDSVVPIHNFLLQFWNLSVMNIWVWAGRTKIVKFCRIAKNDFVEKQISPKLCQDRWCDCEIIKKCQVQSLSV